MDDHVRLNLVEGDADDWRARWPVAVVPMGIERALCARSPPPALVWLSRLVAVGVLAVTVPGQIDCLALLKTVARQRLAGPGIGADRVGQEECCWWAAADYRVAGGLPGRCPRARLAGPGRANLAQLGFNKGTPTGAGADTIGQLPV
jgi:hypothetical protein